MLNYNANLKDKARQLRKNLKDGEKSLWSRLRNKQLLGIQFYRQKPIGDYIVDFFRAQGEIGRGSGWITAHGWQPRSKGWDSRCLFNLSWSQGVEI